ncbi:hypothetical protein KP509_02G045000 [Ceratopteris richardii]|uniref:TANGO6 HEAT repeat domain-containing protein n=1 Tax=Ceratopteris richardii TaxID=49495 RepID=A0A8T2VCH0_CERRI|nr:hypothetical protein KP509_02G045000 [Ceratopteris richardii]
MEASSRGEIFSKGKLLLASFGGSKEKGNVFKESSRAAETLCSLINLLQTLQNSLSSETVPLEPSSPDWKILKALLELLVRIGISPHLSPGVGIRRGEQEKSFQSISVQLSGLFISNPLLQSYRAASVTDTTLLFICAETLSSFLWKASGHFPIPSSLPTAPASFHVEESSRTDTDVGNERMNDIGSPASSRGHSPDEKTPVIAMSRSIVMDKYIPDIKEFQLLQSTALIVLNYFLWDLIAAYSELSFGPRKTDEEIRQHGKLRIMHMIDYLPVDQVIEASFVLLNRHEPNPPPWMKAELGKQLSMLVTRSDGLVSILKELIGRVVKGNVESYEKVAAHLAKVPKSIATPEEYLKALCPQVLPLLLKHKPRELVMGEISSAASNNVFHTAVSLACRLLLAEPRLGINYLVQPIMRPLLVLNSVQANLHLHQTPTKRVESEHVLGPVTENEVVDSLVQLGVLLTAGCQGSSTVRELILHEARIITSLLLELHFQLVSSNSFSRKGSPDNVNIQVCNEKVYGFKGKGIKKGFLHKGLSSSSSEDEIYKDESNLSKLQSSLADIVMAIVSQSIESALPCIVPFMLDHKVDVVRWPQDEGEVWEALQLKGFQTRSRVMYALK